MPYVVSEEKEIEEAINYLVFSIHRSGKNPKPVILHSIRVGIGLYRLDCPKEVVIGGILHDLLEDTNVSFDDLKERFGSKVARLVQACSFDESIRDKTEQYRELYDRCLKEGEGALLIKIADFIDNLPYMLDVKYAGDLCDFLQEKTQYFMELVRPEMKNQSLFRELIKQFTLLTRATP
ncbi:MAG: hypothetical protein A2Z29_03195 [Chloroflexi bacterium RBG_16_56_11]|nr:MAG: hypothetical protein A2Z29_03195 [Chloroflexi bacterium RBG_16_56_11]